MASSSLRSDTEPEDELDAALFPETRCASSLNESCDGDVEDEPLSGLVKNPGTTRGTKLSVLQRNTFPIWGQSWLLTAHPLIGVSVVYATAYLAVGQQAFPRVITRLRTDSSHERTLAPPRGCALLHGFLDLFPVPISSELNSFLLIMCIDAPESESTTNSHSSGLFEATGADMP